MTSDKVVGIHYFLPLHKHCLVKVSIVQERLEQEYGKKKRKRVRGPRGGSAPPGAVPGVNKGRSHNGKEREDVGTGGDNSVGMAVSLKRKKVAEQEPNLLSAGNCRQYGGGKTAGGASVVGLSG